jgi:hypothetical protein
MRCGKERRDHFIEHTSPRHLTAYARERGVARLKGFVALEHRGRDLARARAADPHDPEGGATRGSRYRNDRVVGGKHRLVVDGWPPPIIFLLK